MKPSLLLLVALAPLAGCKKEPPAAAVPPPAPPSASAPAPVPARAPAPVEPVKKEPLTEVPGTDSTLSLLEPQEGRCQWLRADPVAQKRATVASLEGDCKGAHLFWTADLGKVLVWFEPEHVSSGGYSADNVSPQGFPVEEPTPGAVSRLYEVTVASGQVRPVPVPTVAGSLVTFGYKGTELLALSQQSLTDKQREKDSITVDGRKIPFDKELEGIPALAHAYRFGAEGTWQRIEVKATAEGADYSPGVRNLEVASSLGPTSDATLETGLDEENTVQDEALLQKLLPLRPAPLLKLPAEEEVLSGSWNHVTTPGGSFYVWQVSGEFVHSTGHLVLKVGGQLQPVKDLGFTEGDFISLTGSGPFILVAADGVGTHPRMYDLRTGKRVFHSDTARVATFWPRPAPKSQE